MRKMLAAAAIALMALVLTAPAGGQNVKTFKAKPGPMASLAQ